MANHMQDCCRHLAQRCATSLSCGSCLLCLLLSHTLHVIDCCFCPLQTPYIHFMRMLFAATSSHPMIVLEFRHVSMRLCFRAGEVDHAAHAVAAIVQRQGFKEACVVGHSFGTFVASRLCQLHPSLVQSLVSTDCAVPACLSPIAVIELCVGPCWICCSCLCDVSPVFPFAALLQTSTLS